MTDRGPATAPAGRPPTQRPTLAHSVLAIAAAATTSAALVWTALFYNATKQHNVASTQPASATQTAPVAGAPQPAPALAPVTTRAS